ncbi:hypothetical protein [Nitrospira lenta]|uniref:Uncharacterized protein n=1 Tax=Nitrospira lenta TaxID=1436998 RepID=A0A330LCV8_9BACT|nr:hypothetical protein [Nitrospira lenta]SPP66883.1 exported hypothetical protein [Nitrospira lenta]
MTRKARISLRSLCAAMVSSIAFLPLECVKVPRHYVRMAEPGTTLFLLVAHSEQYRGKVVMLGGAYIEEEEDAQFLRLHVTNRPLDQDYIPHRPPIQKGSEAGSYWVVVEKTKRSVQY